MQQNRPVRYNFDTVFGSKGVGAAHARSSYSSDEVEAIRRDTFAQGKADTEAQAAAARAATLGAIAQGLVRMLGEFDAVVRTMRDESAALAVEVGRKLAEVALAAAPLKEVEAMIAECMHKLHREPRLVVRVAPACAEELRADIDRLAAEHAFAGRVVILAEPALGAADCRIEWADGGVERDLAQTCAAIEQGYARWRASNPTEES